MDFYADNAAEQLQAFAFDRRRGKRFGIPDYQMNVRRVTRYIAYVHWSRDCDCVEGERIVVLPATLEALQAELDRQHQWADGPFSFTPVPLRDAAEFEGWTRDRALEAYENGHPHAIYDGDDDDGWY